MTANYKLVYHGNKANLPAVRDAGSFYLTDDTRELYFGDKKYDMASLEAIRDEIQKYKVVEE